MLLMLARMVPNAGLRVIFSADTRTSWASTATVVPTRTWVLSSPLGPLTATRPSATDTDTPLGIATGSFPTLDMASPPTRSGRRARRRDPLRGLAVGHQ